ncbi:MAG: hypothetical protein AB7W59_22085, partial [Acidimicrobiia bacterium]
FITHDFVEALKIGNRIAILNDGAVEQVGRPAACGRGAQKPVALDSMSIRNWSKGTKFGRRACPHEPLSSPPSTGSAPLSPIRQRRRIDFESALKELERPSGGGRGPTR